MTTPQRDSLVIKIKYCIKNNATFNKRSSNQRMKRVPVHVPNIVLS